MKGLQPHDRPAFRDRTFAFWCLGFCLAWMFATFGVVLVCMAAMFAGPQHLSTPWLVAMACGGLATMAGGLSWTCYSYPFGHPVRFPIPPAETHPVAAPLLARVDELLNRRRWGIGSQRPRSRTAADWVRRTLESEKLSAAERTLLVSQLESLTNFSGVGNIQAVASVASGSAARESGPR